MRKRAMTWSVFDRRYEPIDAPDGGQVFQEHAETKPFARNHVWTLVDGDNGESYIVPDYHFVNRLGYMITKNAWTEADLIDLVVKW